jgi:hypothetical protein
MARTCPTYMICHVILGCEGFAITQLVVPASTGAASEVTPCPGWPLLLTIDWDILLMCYKCTTIINERNCKLDFS